MSLILVAAMLAIDNRFCALSFELKCLGMSFGGGGEEQNKISQSLGTQHGRPVIKVH